MSKQQDDKPTQPTSAPSAATYDGSKHQPSISRPLPLPSLGMRPVAVSGPELSSKPSTLVIDGAGQVQHAPSTEPSSHLSRGAEASIEQADAPKPETAQLHLRQPVAAPTDAVVARLDHKPLVRSEL